MIDTFEVRSQGWETIIEQLSFADALNEAIPSLARHLHGPDAEARNVTLSSVNEEGAGVGRADIFYRAGGRQVYREWHCVIIRREVVRPQSERPRGHRLEWLRITEPGAVS